jgi:hypothetical protein
MGIGSGPGKGSTPSVSLMAFANGSTLYVFSLWLVPEHDLYCRFNYLVRNLRCSCSSLLFSSFERVADNWVLR